MSESLSWEILAKDHMSEVLDKLSRASEKLTRSLGETGREGQAMGRKLDEAEPHANRLHSGLERLGTMAHATASMLGNLGANAVMGLLSAAKSGAQFAIETAASNEQAQISFEVLLGSAQKAGDFLKQLQAFAAATPFDMPSLRDAASRLLAVGVNTKDVIPLMTQLGNATAGMGTGAEGINRAVYALQQIKQGGIVHAGDLMQLTDAGIPALDALAAHTHKTVAQVKKDVESNKVTPDMIFGALEQGEGPAFARLKGMMDKQSTTLSGLWSTFKDNASQSLAQFVEPAIPKLKKLLDFAAVAAPKMLTGIQDAAAKLGKVFSGSGLGDRMWTALQKAGKEIIPAVKKGMDDLFKTLEKHKDGLIKFGNLIINDVIPALGWLAKTGFGTLIKAIEGVIIVVSFLGEHFQQFKNIAVGMLRSFVDFAMQTFSTFLHGADAAFGWIPGLGPKLHEATKKFDEFARGVDNALANLTKPRTISISARFTSATAAAAASNVGAGGHGFQNSILASGGYVPAASGIWAPDVLRVGENGPEEMYRDGNGWRVKPNNQMGSGRSTVDVVDVPLRFRNAVTGEVIQEALLRLSKQRGYRTVAQLLPVGS